LKLLTFTADSNSESKLGVHLEKNLIVDMGRAYQLYFNSTAPDWFRSVSNLLAGGEPAMQLAREVFDKVKKQKIADDYLLHDMDKIVFHPPAGDRAKILCVTMNYAGHAHASGSKPSEDPYFFIKFSTIMTAHGSPICASKTSKKHDSEIELGVIIGKRGKYISRENAFDYIAGYTVINDFTFRDRRSLSEDPNSARLHWFTLKNLDNAAPIGPWLVTKDEIPDPYALDINLTLDNDPDQKQSGSTSGMMHRIEDLIYHASNGLTLEPGDVIATGTPHEVAFGKERWLKDGDILRAEITGIGALVNPIRQET
jgi:2-keto-4-pentenoate hydratase/2-oxohepta-3-ene-1,7-dioic acid hydratase in catechol pathway